MMQAERRFCNDATDGRWNDLRGDGFIAVKRNLDKSKKWNLLPNGEGGGGVGGGTGIVDLDGYGRVKL